MNYFSSLLKTIVIFRRSIFLFLILLIILSYFLLSLNPLKSMSQITVNIIVSLIWLIISILEKSARLVNTIIDIVDDGVINNSFEKPVWYQKVCSILVALQDKRVEVESLVDDVRSSQKS